MTTESVHTNPDGSQVAVTLGDGVTLGHDVTLGDYVWLGDDVKLGNSVTLGEYVRLGNGVRLANFVTLGNYVRLGEYVWLGDGVTLGNSVTLGNYVSLGNRVTLGNYVMLGNRATLGIGVTLASDRDVIECRAGSGPNAWLAYRDANEWSFTAGCFGPAPLFVDPNMNPDDQPPHVVAEREAALTYLRAMANARTSGIA